MNLLLNSTKNSSFPLVVVLSQTCWQRADCLFMHKRLELAEYAIFLGPELEGWRENFLKTFCLRVCFFDRKFSTTRNSNAESLTTKIFISFSFYWHRWSLFYKKTTLTDNAAAAAFVDKKYIRNVFRANLQTDFSSLHLKILKQTFCTLFVVKSLIFSLLFFLSSSSNKVY